MQTPDGAWRIEVVMRGASWWFGVVNESPDIELDWLAISALSASSAGRAWPWPRC
jgi:hypothetical protein